MGIGGSVSVPDAGSVSVAGGSVAGGSVAGGSVTGTAEVSVVGRDSVVGTTTGRVPGGAWEGAVGAERVSTAICSGGRVGEGSCGLGSAVTSTTTAATAAAQANTPRPRPGLRLPAAVTASASRPPWLLPPRIFS